MVLVVVGRNYGAVKCRAMQSEAKFSLHEIYAAQKLYFTEHERYATMEELIVVDKRVNVPQKFYTMSDHFSPTNENFVVVAKGAVGTLVEGEEWTIDQTNTLIHRKEVCKN